MRTYSDEHAKSRPVQEGSEVWAVEVKSGKARNLTAGWGTTWGPSWSPDGGRHAFDECDAIDVQISAFTVPELVDAVDQIRIGTDGIVLQKVGRRRG